PDARLLLQPIADGGGSRGSVGVDGVDDPTALDLDPGHVGDVGVVDEAAVPRVREVVVGQRVAADVDVATVARRRGRQALASVPGSAAPLVRRYRAPGLSRPAIEDVEHLHAAGRDAHRIIAERGHDDWHALLTGRLVAGDAQDAELIIGTRINEWAGGR